MKPETGFGGIGLPLGMRMGQAGETVSDQADAASSDDPKRS